jgi:hypothetical protein
MDEKEKQLKFLAFVPEERLKVEDKKEDGN